MGNLLVGIVVVSLLAVVITLAAPFLNRTIIDDPDPIGTQVEKHQEPSDICSPKDDVNCK